MATSNKTFNANVIAKVDLQQGDATRIMEGLVRIQKELSEGFVKTANNARVAFDSMAARPGDVKALEDYQKALSSMQVELKALSTYKSGINVVKDSDLQKANQLLGQMNQLARVFQDMQKQKGIEAGTFGMDSKSAKEALKNLKDLEKAAQSVKGAMELKGDTDGSLTKYKQKIDANTAALIKHIDALRSATTLEEAHSKALIANAAREAGIRASRAKLNDEQALAQRQKEIALQALNAKGFEDAEKAKNLALKRAQDERDKLNEQAALRYNQLMGRQAAERKKMDDDEALRQNLALKRTQEMQYKLLNSGAAQSRASREALDLSATGRAASAYGFQQFSDRQGLLANPAFQAQDAARRQRQAQEAALREVYSQANARPEVSGMYRTASSDIGNPARVQAAQTILGLQRQLVDLQQKGTLTDAESLRLRGEITKAIAGEVQARNRAGNQQAQQNQAERNMARVGGVGGASLLAVQASLMANYSILNGLTGSVRAAITNSIELEAAFRNVQAVTATTSTEMGTLEKKIKDVAAGSKFTALEVANAALTLGQAGLSAKAVGESIQSVVMLAAAAGTNIAQAVDLVTSVIGVFDKKASDTADIANKITASANSSKVSVEKLALGFQYAGNTAALMGVSFEETTAAMAAMSNAGIKSGSTMGTGLRQFLVETQKPSEEFMATISRIGLTMADLDFKSNGLIGVSRKLREAGFIASDAIKSFDIRGAAAFNAMIANPDELERQYRLLLNTKAGVEANEIQMNSLKSQAARLTTSLTNLATAGFEPIGKLLTVVSDKLATGIQAMSEYKVTAGILGTLIGTTLVSAMVLHTASLASGALALLGVNTAALVAFRGLTLLGAGQAVLTGLTTGFVALRTAAAAGAAAYTIAASQGVVATTLWGASVAGLTGAFRALWATITGLSVMTGLGIVIAGVATAMYLLRSSSETTKEEMDKLKAKTAEAQGAFKEKQDQVVSLTAKINELSYKQADAKASTQDLTTTSLALASQFGNIGYAADQTTQSYGGMITKLKQLRGEMQLLAQAKLKEAIRENGTQLKKETEVASEKLSAAKGSSNAIDMAMDKYGKSLTPSQINVLKLAQGEIKAGDPTKAANITNATDIIKSLADAIMAAGNKSDKDRVNARTLLGASTDLGSFATADVARRQSASEAAGLQLQQRNYADGLSYDKRPVTVGGKTMSLSDAKEILGGNMRGKVPTTGNKLVDYDNFYQTSQKEIEYLGDVMDVLIKDKQDPKANKEVVNNNIIDLRGKIEGIKNDVKFYAKETQAKADREYRNEAMRLKAMAGNKNKGIAAQAILDLGQLNKKYKTRGIIDADEKFNAEQAIEDTAEIRAGNKLQVSDKSHKRDIASQVRERVLKLQEAQLLREADALKGDALLSGDSDVAGDLLTKGLAKVKAAGDKAVLAAMEKQKQDLAKAPIEEQADLEKSFKAEIAAIKATFAERAKQFITSFKGFTGAAAQALKALEMQIDEQKNALNDQKIAGEDRIYNEGSNLRQMQLDEALGKKTRDRSVSSSTNYKYDVVNGGSASTSFGSKGVSVSLGGSSNNDVLKSGGSSTSRSNLGGFRTAGGSLKQRLSSEIIRVAQIELEENEKFLDLLGDADAGLIGSLTKTLNLAAETYRANQAKLLELQAIQKANGGKLTNAQRDDMQQLSTELPSQQGAVKEAQSALNSAIKDRRTARNDNNDIQIKIAKNTETLPQEVSIKNITSALDVAWQKWQDVVADMDVVKVLGDGMSSVLGSLTGSLGNTFAAIASGTKSIKDGVRDMATSVIKSMMDIVAQALAMQAVKGLMSFLGVGMGMMGAGTDVGMSSTLSSSLFGAGAVAAASGGYMNMDGRLERVQAFKNGGPVRGGVQGRDSVPARLMPGEFVLKSAAVKAVGTDYLHSLNQASNSVTSSNNSKLGTTGSPTESSVVNVWVVTPDQKPSGMGPKDIVAIVSDDISRGGSLKKLIKQVNLNQV